MFKDVSDEVIVGSLSAIIGGNKVKVVVKVHQILLGVILECG